jgi:hypothetical protein
MYEDLVADPFATMARIFDGAYGGTDGPALRAALERADKKNFQKWEAERGAPAISEQLRRFEKSFIRSGVVGEGEAFFTQAQRDRIRALVEAAGCGMDGAVRARGAASAGSAR